MPVAFCTVKAPRWLVAPAGSDDAGSTDALSMRGGWGAGCTASVTVQSSRLLNPVFELSKAPSERLRVYKIAGDGRCMFRAIAQGLARARGLSLMGPEETHEADLLREAVYDTLCRGKPRAEFRAAVKSAEVDAPLSQYCPCLLTPTFWGGDPELHCLSELLRTPIFVYLSQSEQGTGEGFVPIQKYGERYQKKGKSHKARKPLRLLYTQGNHYDLLLA